MLCGISQTRTVSGVLTDTNGNPLPGVSVLIKGTQTGTVTDINGYYSIEAPVGSTLVFSYVGFLNKEMLVTPDSSSLESMGSNQHNTNNQLKKNRLLRPGNLKDSSKGFASLDQSQSFNKNRLINKWSYTNYDTYHTTHYRWYFTGEAELFFSFDRPVYNLKLQKTYSQGRNENGSFIYRGPETGEVFSWGPPIKNLEYSDQDYPYDIRGKLVHKGTGNGIPALIFDSLNLFHTGYKTIQNLHFITGNYCSKIFINYNHTFFSGIIPSSRMHEHNMSLLLNQKIGSKITTDFSLRYFNADAMLMNSFSQSRIFSMALRTPVTFDNTNGLDDASKNQNAWLTPSGTQRSFAPTLADNPFWLIHSIKDSEINNKLFSSFGVRVYPANSIEMHLNASANSQKASNIYGYKAGTAFFNDGILIDRTEKYNTISIMAGTSLNKTFDRHSVNFLLDYQKDYAERILNRTATIDTNDTGFKNNISRLSSQIKLTGKYKYSKGLTVNFSTIAYNSSTHSKTSWMPMAGLSLIPTDRFKMGEINSWKLNASWSITHSEAPLQYRRGMMNSILFTAAESDRYFETEEITSRNITSLEKTMNFEIGTELYTFSEKLYFSFYWYNKKINNYIYPVYIAGKGFTPVNTGDLVTTGIDADIHYVLYSWRVKKWEIALNFHKYSTVVKKVNNAGEIILGGFSDVSSCMIQGQPYGIIKGSAYLRDDNGKLIIGNDGFPMVDPQRRIIGNPNPDWLMGIENKFTLHQFSFRLLIDFRKGGDIWNGTRNTLNYLGLGRETESDRLTRDFIFDGVLTDGQVNNIPVSFCDPSLPLEENRWVRYGYAGVAEDAIEDGSFVRLKEFRFTYKTLVSTFLRELQFEIFASNLFCISRYKGLCPYTSMLAFSNNTGFDFFNLPSVRTYGIAVKIFF